MRVLVAPGAFSGTLTAVAAAEAIARGWRVTAPEDELDVAPMSDGGAGLVSVAHARHGGRTLPLTVAGALGEEVPAVVLLAEPPGRPTTAYVEADAATGVHLTRPEERAEAAATGTSAGVGELVAAAVDLGARRVVLGAGEAASHDGGWGFLCALAGTGTPPPGSGRSAAQVLGAARDRLVGVELVVAAATPDPLVGLHGAGAALGRRAGVGAARAQELEHALMPLLEALESAAAAVAPRQLPLAGASVPPRPARRAGSGAGGGVAFATAVLGARLVPGGHLVASELDLAARAGRADVVVTGAAAVDAGQVTEDGPGVVAAVGRAGAAHGVPVVVIGEQVGVGRREVAAIGVSALYQVDGGGEVDGGTGLDARLAARATSLARTWSW